MLFDVYGMGWKYNRNQTNHKKPSAYMTLKAYFDVTGSTITSAGATSDDKFSLVTILGFLWYAYFYCICVYNINAVERHL